MSSHRAARSRSHARRKDGPGKRNLVLALGALTVTAGVGATLLTGGGDQGGEGERVAASAADALPDTAAGEDTTGSASPSASASASPSPSATPSPTKSVPVRPKAKKTPTTAPKTNAKSAKGTGGSGGGRASGPVSGGSGSGSGGSGDSDGGSSNGAEAQVLALVNKERASAGCSPLTANAQLTEAADDYSDVMAASGVMSHTGPDGSTMTSRVEAAGYAWSTLGENIARGQADAASVMDSWMNSPGHRANILNCSFKEIGVGVHVGDGGPWWTQNFGARR
ncbi:CAP domain-containing protein [Streptomyces sp. NPDC096193]|uniref:CAP domain-containing protein n=1 Tax=Streptomyces sp. NPDC096193 TaxID=3155821 RepID=UPI0033215CC1